MKTRTKILLIGLLSIVPLFPQESEARLFSALLIGAEKEALRQVQLSDSQESNFFADKGDELRSLKSGCEHYLELALDDECAVVAVLKASESPRNGADSRAN